MATKKKAAKRTYTKRPKFADFPVDQLLAPRHPSGRKVRKDSAKLALVRDLVRLAYRVLESEL